MAIAGNILGEATPPAGNSFNEATRGKTSPIMLWESRRVTGSLRPGVIGLERVEPRHFCLIRNRCRRVPHRNGESWQR